MTANHRQILFLAHFIIAETPFFMLKNISFLIITKQKKIKFPFQRHQALHTLLENYAKT